MSWLDFLTSQDPLDQARLNLAGGLLAGSGGWNTAIGKSLLNTQSATDELATSAARRRALQQEMELRTQEQQRQQQLMAQQAKALQDQETFRQLLLSRGSPQMQAVGGALAGGGGPTVANAAKIPAVDPLQSLLYQALSTSQIKPMEYVAAIQKDTAPKLVAEGTKVFSPDYKTLLAENPKNDQTPDEKNYAQAVKQGFQGSILDFILAKQKAGAAVTNVTTKINAFTPASEEAQKQFMQKIATRYDQLQSAPAALNNIERAKQLAAQPNVFVGSFGDKKMAVAQFFNNNFGTSIAAESIRNASELQSRLFVQVMENLKKMDAQPSQYQQQVMQKAFGEVTTDPGAIPRVLDVFAEIVKQKVAIHNKEAADSIKRGVVYPFDPIIQLPDTTAVTPGVDDLVNKYRSR